MSDAIADALIAALLPDPAASWNQGDGHAVVLAFSFATDGIRADGSRLAAADWAPFSAPQQEAARQALAAWGGLAGVTFVEVPDSPGGALADLRFRLETLDPWWMGGEAWFPPVGDVALNLASYRGNALAPGGRGFETLLHEIGHALGLRHPFEGAVPLPVAMQTRDVSIMADAHGALGVVAAPRALDAAALAALYGQPEPAAAAPGLAGGRILITGGAGDDVLHGSAWHDRIDGRDGADRLLGGGGDDVLLPGPGGGLVDGGAGFDLLVLDGLHRARLPAGLAVTGIEAIAFADGRLVLDATDPAALVARLMAGAGLPPEAEHLGEAAAALAAGAPPALLADGLLAEVPAGQALLTTAYHALLGREPDAAGLNWWTAQLADGASPGSVLAAIAASPEAVADWSVGAGLWVPDPAALAVARLYATALGRMPDAGGLDYWRESGLGAAGLARALTGSAEFAAHAPDDGAALIAAFYREGLGREGLPAEIAWWAQALAAGSQDLAGAALAFASSPEMLAHSQSWAEAGLPIG